MISFTRQPSSRYLFFIQIKTADQSSVFKMFCDNVAEVRGVAARNWSRWDGRYGARLSLSNGYTPRTLPAAMIVNCTKRYGRCIVATAPCNEMGIIAL